MSNRIARVTAAVTLSAGLSIGLAADGIAKPDFCDTQTFGQPERKERRDEAFMSYLQSGQLTLVPNSGEKAIIRNPGRLYPTRAEESGEDNCQLVEGSVVELSVRRGYPVTIYTRPGAILAGAPAHSDSGYSITYLGDIESGFSMYQIAGPMPETLSDYTAEAIMILDISQLDPSVQLSVAEAYPNQHLPADD
jgi:hypothetical protein